MKKSENVVNRQKNQNKPNSDLSGFSYAIPVPTTGAYRVRLHFAETYWGATGGYPCTTNCRVFSVNLEGGVTELQNYDINAEVGPMTAVIKEYTVGVNDGILNIDFTASVNRPIISGIEVFQTANSPTPTSIPTATATNTNTPTATATSIVVPPTITNTPTPTTIPVNPHFASSTYWINESGVVTESVAQVRLGIVLASAQTQPVTVTYSTVAGTAQANVDYQTVSAGSVTFAAGETQKSIIIPLIEDGVAENDETFTVQLSNGATTVVTIGANDRLRVTEQVIYVSDAAGGGCSGICPTGGGIGNGSSSVAVVTLQLNAPSRLPVSVQLRTRDGTALKNSDYYGATGSVSFPFSQWQNNTQSTSFSVTIILDSVTDDGEVFYIDATSATNAQLDPFWSTVEVYTQNNGSVLSGAQ